MKVDTTRHCRPPSWLALIIAPILCGCLDLPAQLAVHGGLLVAGAIVEAAEDKDGHNRSVEPKVEAQATGTFSTTIKNYCWDAQQQLAYAVSATRCFGSDEVITEAEYQRRRAGGELGKVTVPQPKVHAYCWNSAAQHAYYSPDGGCGADTRISQEQFNIIKGRQVASQQPPAGKLDEASSDEVAPPPAMETAPEPTLESTIQSAAVDQPTKPVRLDVDAFDYHGNGTAFFVSPVGHLVTNAHVVAECPVLGAAIQGEGVYAATLITADEDTDMALAQVRGLQSRHASFANRLPAAGDDIYAVGFPLFTEFWDIKITEGIVSGLRGLNGDPNTIQISAPVQPGNSGGPLLDSAGSVVGVISHKRKAYISENAVAEGVAFAISPQTTALFLKTHGVPLKINKSEKEIKAREVMRDAMQWTIPLLCLERRS